MLQATEFLCKLNEFYDTEPRPVLDKQKLDRIFPFTIACLRFSNSRVEVNPDIKVSGCALTGGWSDRKVQSCIIS